MHVNEKLNKRLIKLLRYKILMEYLITTMYVSDTQNKSDFKDILFA